MPCIDIYALTASATKQVTSMRGLAETDPWEDDEAAKIYLTYSTTRDINRAGPTFEMLVVCIIQVKLDITDLGSDAKLFYPYTTTLIEIVLEREPTPLGPASMPAPLTLWHMSQWDAWYTAAPLAAKSGAFWWAEALVGFSRNRKAAREFNCGPLSSTEGMDEPGRLYINVS